MLVFFFYLFSFKKFQGEDGEGRVSCYEDREAGRDTERSERKCKENGLQGMVQQLSGQ